MKQAKLIDVPKDAPSAKERIKAFKEQHKILTHNSDSCPEAPWLALKPRPEDEGKDMFDIITESCRLYDESGWCAEGKTQTEAIKQLCRNLEIKCNL